MIESNIIPAGENHFIRLCLIEDDYRIRITDLYGNILFELEGEGINIFNSSFNQILLAIQQFKVLDKQKESLRQAIKTNTPIVQPSSGTQQSTAETGTTVKNTPNPILTQTLEIVTIHPKLSQEDLQLCVRAVKEKQKLSKKVTIGAENLEHFILQAFDGEQITYSNMLNECATASIAIDGKVLKKSLNTLVQEGKISAFDRENKYGKFILYAINCSSNAPKKTVNIVLDKLDYEFNTQEFVDIAKRQGIDEQTAIAMLEQSSRNGELLQPSSENFRKIP